MNYDTDALDDEVLSRNNDKELDEKLEWTLSIRKVSQNPPINNIKYMEQMKTAKKKLTMLYVEVSAKGWNQDTMGPPGPLVKRDWVRNSIVKKTKRLYFYWNTTKQQSPN